MTDTEKAFRKARKACAYFYVYPGMIYGIFTARLPAYKNLTGATDSEIGLILLAFGIASLITLFTCHLFIARYGAAPVLRLGSLLLVLGIVLCGAAPEPITLGLAVMLTGFGTGLSDVAMNATGIELEHRFKVNCMSFLHASFSLGGMAGAVTGSIFAAFGISPFINALIVCGLYLIPFLPAYGMLPHLRATGSKTDKKSSFARIPFYIVCCGLLAMLVDAVEGSVGEWGSLFLNSEKGATQQLSALAYAALCLTMVSGRLAGDWLRTWLGDLSLLFGGSLLAFTGMAIAIFNGDPVICLIGYALVGLGISPLLPIFFSRAGDYPGVNAAQASTTVSTLAYSGMLFFPPLLGFLADHFGLGRALYVALGACVILAIGAFPITRFGRKREARGASK